MVNRGISDGSGGSTGHRVYFAVFSDDSEQKDMASGSVAKEIALKVLW